MPLVQQNTPPQVATEMRQGRPWWKVCCGGCCSLVAVAVIASGLAWRGAGGGSGPRIVNELPSNFPPGLTLYRLDQARSIEYFSGRDKDRTFTILMSPLRFFGNIMVSSSEKDAGSASGASGSIDRFMETNASRLQQIDTVTVYWDQLDVSKDDLYVFYLEQFRRNGYVIDSRRDELLSRDTIIARQADITAQLSVQDSPDIRGIDTVTIVINYSNQ